MIRRCRIGLSSAFAIAICAGVTLAGQDRPTPPAQDQASGRNGAARKVVTAPGLARAGRHDTSPALRDLPPLRPREERDTHAPLPVRLPPGQAAPALADPVLQSGAPLAAAPPPILNFEGVGNLDGVLPPDTNGDLGPNHYVQWVNKTLAIYGRSGSLLYGPASGSTIWSGFGGPCETQNDGDPIVLYDHLADRWVMSQFAIPNNIFGLIIFGPFYQCVAVSATPDPTGPYHRYEYEFQKLNDYPKLGVWPDAYYMSINQYTAVTLGFAGQGVVAFDRAAMLAGQPAQMIYFDLQSADPTLGGMLPADLDGPPPPAGSPNYFVEVDDDGSGFAQDQLQLWRFHVDWATPATSTFSGPYILPVAPFDSNMCGYDRACIPQPGTTAKLDALSDRLMYRLQYRNFGTHESLVVNHTVDADGSDHAGVRWYEVRDPGGTPFVYQQGTWAPDGFHRWMASAAMDAAGNLALAYNVAGPTLSASIRYAARLATDAPGTLGLGENDLITGTGSQTHTASRWGDYSMLTVDPVDGCTFWATAEYFAATSDAGWQTRIGAFKLPGCGTSGPPPAAPASLSATAISSARIDLAWSDLSTDELGFSIERCVGTTADCAASGAFAQAGQAAANATTWSDTGRSGSTTYSYRMRSYNSNGFSDYSNLAQATTAPTPPPPTVTVTAPVATATEAGPTSGSFRISRGVAQAAPLTVSFTVTGSATKGSDYITLPASATIPDGAAYVDLGVTPLDDTTIEADETVVLTLAAASGYTVGSPGAATVTIVSDDVSTDLTVSALGAPAVGGAGQTITLTDTTKNQGTGAAPASSTTFYLSANSLLDAADTVLGSREVPTLAPGATSSGSITATLPSSMASGNWYLFAKADGPEAIGESSEYNNTRLVAIRIGPDLVMTALTAPSTAGAGAPFTVTDTTKNQGGGDAAASVTRFYLSTNYSLDASDTALQSHAVPVLAAGATHSASTSVTVPADTPAGLYYLIAAADADDSVNETYETNNSRYVTVRFGADLTVTGISAPLRIAGLSTITVTDTVKNSGGGASGASVTGFYLSGDLSLDPGDARMGGTRAVPSLAAGDSSAGATPVTVPDIVPGVYYLTAHADDADAVLETSETNNTRYTIVYLGPDLYVSALSLPSTLTAGSTVSITDTVRNQGAAVAAASTTKFFLSVDSKLDASDVELTGERAVPALAYSASSSGTTGVVIPAGVSGKYYILAVADGPGVVPESTETNNVGLRLVTINP
jgi:subtilase family serine protease